MSYSVSLAHLSDLHFGDQSRFKDKDPEKLGRECAQAIKTGMLSNFNKNKTDLVIVTGDITQQAEKWEFHKATKFFKSLQASLETPRTNFIFLPGNHDVSWMECRNYSKINPQENIEIFNPSLEKEKLGLFNSFKDEFYGDEHPEGIVELDCGAALYVYPKYCMYIVALNSCERETHEKHVGIISETQAEKVMKTLLDNYDKYIKIVALHHAFKSDSEKVRPWLDYLKNECEKDKIKSELLDRLQSDALSVKGSPQIESIIKDCRVHLVLHGHQHAGDSPTPFRWSSTTEVHCQVCPAGSFGLISDKLPIDQPNCLRLIHLFKENKLLRLATTLLEYDPRGRLEGQTGSGCFRVNNNNYKASFPFELDSRCWQKNSEGETTSDKEPNLTVFAFIQIQIKLILMGSPDFSRILANMMKIKNFDVSDKNEDKSKFFDTLSQALVKKGFKEVWKNIARDVSQFRDHFDELKRILFLLAQGVCKNDIVADMRKQIQSENDDSGYVFYSPIRYPLTAELVLKTALETEIEVAPIIKDEKHYVEVDYVINLIECGIDQNKKREYLEKELWKRLRDPHYELQGKERLERLIGRLEAYFQSNKPFILFTDDPDFIPLPFMVHFLVPTKKEYVPPNGVTSINEDTVYELINIILNTLQWRRT